MIQRRTSKQLVLFFFTLILLTGCTYTPPNKCHKTNWYEQGYQDAVSGETRTRYFIHRDECYKLGGGMDKEEYYKGHAMGVLKYCTKENALAQGKIDKDYKNPCTGKLRIFYQENYQRGSKITAFTRKLNLLELSREGVMQNLTKAKNPDRRIMLNKRIQELDVKIRKLRTAIEAL